MEKENLNEVIDGINARITLVKALDAMPDIRTEPRMLLPDPETFNRLYRELRNQNNNRPVVKFMNEMLQIESPSVKIFVGTDAVIEMLADKFKTDIPLDIGMKFIQKPLFVEEMDKIIASKLDWIRVEFQNKILTCSDKRVEKLCYDYHRTMAVPYLTNIGYLKWKESLISYQIKVAVEKMESQKNVEIRKAQNDYLTKFDEYKIKASTEIDKLKNMNARLMENIQHLNSAFNAKIEENQNIKSDIETSHLKLRDAENKALEMEKQLIESQRLLKDAQAKLERYQSTRDEWIEDACNGKNPVWKNTITKDIVKLSVSKEEFFEMYTLDRVEGTDNIYMKDDGTEIKLPESLGDSLTAKQASRDEEDEVESTPGTKQKKEKGLRPNDQKVVDAVESSDHPLTQEEIADITEIPVRNVTNYTQKMVSRKLIIEGYDKGKKVYSKPEK